MKGFVAGALFVKALNKLAVEVAKSDSSLGTEIRKKVLAKVETSLLVRTRDEIDAELASRREALS